MVLNSPSPLGQPPPKKIRAGRVARLIHEGITRGDSPTMILLDVALDACWNVRKQKRIVERIEQALADRARGGVIWPQWVADEIT
jgi:hypothetical protein